MLIRFREVVLLVALLVGLAGCGLEGTAVTTRTPSNPETAVPTDDTSNPTVATDTTEAATETAVATAAWQLYENGDGRFSIQFPAEFTLYEEKQPSVDGALVPASNTLALRIPNGRTLLSITYFPIEPNTTLAQFVDATSTCADITAAAGESLALNGHTFLFYRDTPCDPAGATYFYTVQGDRGYRITLETSLDYAAVQSAIEPVLATFRSTAVTATVTPPSDAAAANAGVLYRTAEGLWLVDASGQSRLLTPHSQAAPSPDAQLALYRDESGALWILNLVNGSEQKRTLNVQPVGSFSWVDEDVVSMGVWLQPSDQGPNAGHPALYRVSTGTLLVVDRDRLSAAPAAPNGDGRALAYDNFDTAFLYRLENGGANQLDLTRFAGFDAGKSYNFGSAAWSPDGQKIAWRMSGGLGPGGSFRAATVIFDLAAGTAATLHTYNPVDSESWPPAPAWSPDGRWLAQIVPAGSDDESGLWLIAADGSEVRRVAPLPAGEPTWLPGSTQLLFTNYAAEQASRIERYDLTDESRTPLALPAGARLAGVVDELAATAPTPEPPEPAENGTPSPTPDLEQLTPETRSYFSPDGTWVAEVTVALPFVGDTAVADVYYEKLTVARTDDSARWTVLERWSPYGLGYTTPVPIFWSSDGRSMFFTNRPVPDGCALFTNGADIQQVDLATGSVRQAMPPLANALKIGPDGRTAAYFGTGEAATRLTLRDLSTGVERWVMLNSGEAGVQTGNIAWSPDGSQLLVTIAYSPCQPDAWTQSTLLVNVETLQYRTLIDRDARLFTTETWLSGSRVRLRDAADEPWLLNLETGAIVQE